MAISQMIGAKIHRREDPRLITGGGRYVEDLVRAGHARRWRSCAARTRTRASPASTADAARAHARRGRRAHRRRLQAAADAARIPVAPAFVAEKHTVPDRFPIADDEAVFQGEPVAVVVAENRKQAADAAAAVEVEYEPLPAVMDLDKALEADSPKAHTDLPDNLAWDLTYIA